MKTSPQHAAGNSEDSVIVISDNETTASSSSSSSSDDASSTADNDSTSSSDDDEAEADSKAAAGCEVKSATNTRPRSPDISVKPSLEKSVLERKAKSACCTNSKAMMKAAQTGVNFLRREINHKWILNEETKESQWYLGEESFLVGALITSVVGVMG